MKLTVIKWRDIPTQVMIKKSRREVEKVQLDDRFMEAVDSAAVSYTHLTLPTKA